jgi:hypothetical protein
MYVVRLLAVSLAIAFKVASCKELVSLWCVDAFAILCRDQFEE